MIYHEALETFNCSKKAVFNQTERVLQEEFITTPKVHGPVEWIEIIT